MIKRWETNQVKIGNLVIGGQNKVIIQSMTNTKTKDIESTVAQIKQLRIAGCQLVRVAVLDMEDAKALGSIKKEIDIPIVADIHFDYRLALEAVNQGIDKIRINPGNIGKIENIKLVVDACKEKNIPIRIGINAGSLDKEILEKYNNEITPQAMVDSALKHIKVLEDLNFYDILVSLKASDVLLTVKAYELAANTFNYPLHLGITEAGTKLNGAIKSSVGLGILLNQGIGDTIRVSLSTDPTEEILVAKEILKNLELIKNVPTVISCPTCGRLQYNMLDIVDEIEEFVYSLDTNITVAVMGCAVNGPGEAKRANIGIAGGINEALLFKDGKVVRKIKQENMVEELKKEILIYIKNS